MRNLYEAKDIFVSWNNNDREIKNKIVELLKSHNYSVWESDWDCSGNIIQSTINQISKCSLFLIILTPNSLNSNWVYNEYNEALNKLGDNRILPVIESQELLDSKDYGLFTSYLFENISCVVGFDNEYKLLKNVEDLYLNYSYKLYQKSFMDSFDIKNIEPPMPLTNISDIYVNRTLNLNGEYMDEDAFRYSSESALIVAEGGIGKTSYVKQMAEKGTIENELYFFITAKILLQSSESLFDGLFNQFKVKIINKNFNIDFFKGLLIHKLEQSRVCVIIDGLDEIDECGDINDISKMVTEFTSIFDKTRIILTSRLETHRGNFKINDSLVNLYRLNGINEIEIKTLIHNIFESCQNTDEKYISFKGLSEEKFYKLIVELEDEVKSNPLLVTQLAFIYANDGAIPKTKIEILDRVTEIAIEKIDMDRMSMRMHSLITEALPYIAYYKYKNDKLDFKRILENKYNSNTALEIYNHLTRRGIIKDETFAHKIFIEYFAASYIFKEVFDLEGIKSVSFLSKVFSDFYNNSYWENIVSLLICKIDKDCDEETINEVVNIINKNVSFNYDLILNRSSNLYNKGLIVKNIINYLIYNTVEKNIPYYAHLFYYVHSYELYLELFNVGASYIDDLFKQSKVNDAFILLSLFRDIPYIMCKAIKISDILNDGLLIGKYQLFVQKIGRSYRNNLNALFYEVKFHWLSKDINKADKSIFPYFMNLVCVSKVDSSARFGECPLLTPFADELGMYNHNSTDYNGEFIGLVSADYVHEMLENKLINVDKMIGLALNYHSDIVLKQLKINSFNVEMFLIPSMIVEIDKNALYRLGYNKSLNLIYSYGLTETRHLNITESVMEYNVYLSNSFKKIKHDSFFWSPLTKIFVSSSVDDIEWESFFVCDNLQYISVDKENYNYNSFENCNAIIETKTNKLILGCANTKILNSVKIICHEAFSRNKYLTEITIPKNVEILEYNSFHGCENLETVYIENGVNTIESGSFSNCGKLKTLRLPETITTIPYSLCENCVSLAEIDIPKKVSVVLGGAFKNCQALTEIVIPDGVVELDQNIFNGCINLKRVIIPNSIQKILGPNFNGCYNLDTIELPNGFDYINEYSFSDCINLKNILYKGSEYHSINQLPNYLNDNSIIDHSIDCDLEYVLNSTSQELPPDLEELRKELLSIDFESFSDDGADIITSNLDEVEHKITYDSNCEFIEILDGVERIKHKEFFAFENLEKIILPQTLKYIEQKAFCYCKNLKEITIPAGVEIIMDDAFSRCFNLKKVILPHTLEEIGKRVFYCCSSLEDIILPNITIIPDGTFYNCEKIVRIELPKSIKVIEEKSFFGCNSLEEILLSPNINEISESTFFGCSNLKQIIIPQNVVTISEYAFKNCVSITDVILPDKLIYIDDYAFENCANLSNIVMKNAVEKIGYGAFKECSSLTNIKIPEGLTTVRGETFSGCKSLVEVILPESLKSIDYAAFKDCISLKHISLPYNTEFIHSDAFCGCSLEYIDAPNILESMVVSIFGTYKEKKELTHNISRFILK